jgi:hypothetical protein
MVVASVRVGYQRTADWTIAGEELICLARALLVSLSSVHQIN